MSQLDMSQNRQRQTSQIPGSGSMPFQVSRPSEPSTEVNMDPALGIQAPRKELVVATILLQESLAPEPPLPMQSMSSSRGRIASPEEPSMKTAVLSPAHVGHNLRGVNALYDGATQTWVDTNATFGKNQQAGEPAARSAALKVQNPRASNQTDDTTHRQINDDRATHRGNNMDGVNAIYGSEQHVTGGSLSFR